MAFDDQKLLIHTAQPPQPPQNIQKPRRIRIKTRLTFQERLLRNSCLACAVLLGVLALGSLNQPWAKKASEHIEQALTMEIDLDESLGQLEFVQKLMPESALVFFNLSGSHELAQPVPGSVIHPYSPAQPWLMFEAEPGTAVCSAADGTVAAVSKLSDGSFGVLIDHGEGKESVVACLLECSVHTGDKLVKGAAIGSAAGDLFFELRQGGEAIDPTESLGL